MGRVSIYLNFKDSTEEAFNFYKGIFRSEFAGTGVARFSDVPPSAGAPPLPEKDANLIMHIELPILGGHVLMGSDAPESMGFNLVQGNNFNVMLEPDTRDETHTLFAALSEGGVVNQPLKEEFWGALYGSCTDKYGVHWMFNCTEK